MINCIKMTINGPKEYKVYKKGQHRNGTTSKHWVPMGKSIANLYRYAEISKTANKRFLDSMYNVLPAKSIEKELNEICEKKTVRCKHYTGYNVWSPETFRLFETISDGKYLIHGFTNQEIRRYNNPDTVNECGKMTRSFAKLCAHRLIRKIPHSRRYMVSDKGTSCHVCNH